MKGNARVLYLRLRSHRFKKRYTREFLGGRNPNPRRMETGRGLSYSGGLFQPEANKMVPENEIAALKKKARALGTRLGSLEARIRQMEQGAALKYVAVVDEEKCTGCGICLDTCSSGAVLIESVARIVPEHCIGCGRCAERCPQGAISLRPAEPFHQRK